MASRLVMKGVAEVPKYSTVLEMKRGKVLRQIRRWRGVLWCTDLDWGCELRGV